MSTEYQFPKLSWRSGSTLNSVVEHGVFRNEEGRWNIPEFQRGLVWTEAQKISFIESLVYGLPVGEYTLHKNSDYTYDVLDGQQRWNAIFCYLNNEFPVFGLKWEDLNFTTKNAFMSLPFAYRLVEGFTEEQKIEAYNRLAYGGTPHER